MTRVTNIADARGRRALQRLRPSCTAAQARAAYAELLKLPDNQARAEWLLRNGYVATDVRPVLEASGHLEGAHTPEPCSNPSCGRRIAAKQRVCVIGEMVFCGSLCAARHMEERRA